MSSALALFESARKRGLKLAFVTAGGGAGLFDLFKIPGCSNVMTEARMLYSQESLVSFLDKPIAGPFVSQATAGQLAVALAFRSEATLCFALTCALSTDRKRLGKDHGHLAICRKTTILYHEHILFREADRQEQDRLISEAVLKRVNELIVTHEIAE
jgi:nicotinamide mononucleotide (NMN) deamidase PncC